jgi:hypothetical protein
MANQYTGHVANGVRKMRHSGLVILFSPAANLKSS